MASRWATIKRRTKISKFVIKIKQNYLAVLLIALILVITFWNLGHYGLVDWDEAIYAQVSRNLMQGNPFVLHWGQGEIVWLHKPPLYFWITATFMHLFGVNEFSSRLLSALSGAGLSVVLYLFAKKLFDKTSSLFALIFILLNTFLLYSFRFGTIDIFALFLTTLALYLFWQSQTDKRYIVGSLIVMGLAGLAKGPVIVTPLLVIFLYALTTKQLPAYLKSKSFWLALVTMLLIFLPWHIYMLYKFNPDFYQQYFLYHIVLRSKEAIEGHSGSIFFYPSMLIHNYLYIILIFALPFLGYKKIRSKCKELLFLIIWLLIQYVSIDRVATKLNWYILPVFIPAILILAYLFSELLKKGVLWKIFVALVIVLGAFFSILKPYSYWKDLPSQYEDKVCLQKYSEVSTKYIVNGYEEPRMYYYLQTSDYVNFKNREYALQKGDIVLTSKINGIILYVDQDTVYENSVCKITKIN